MQLNEKVRQAKIRLLQLHYETKTGHVGGNLSCIDLLVCLYHNILSVEDRFILSKGHAAGAWYVALASTGQLREGDLSTFHGEGTKLSGHPSVGSVPGLKIGMGSLGHGLPVSIGIALGKKIKGQPGRVFCLMSDGEWNAGSNWEAVMFATARKASNLTIIVDYNGIQGFGRTNAVLNMGNLSERLSALSCEVEEIDGHDTNAIERSLRKDFDRVRVLIAHTRKGHGIPMLENTVDSHYWPLNDLQYAKAIELLRTA